MISILTGSLVISLLHAIIPNHWLPVIAIGRKEQWTLREVTAVTLASALAHAVSTVLLGIILSMIGGALAGRIESFTHIVAPAILVILGLVFIWRHHRHKHFHVDAHITGLKSKRRIIAALVAGMFFSPCLEIEAYFLMAGAHAPWLPWLIAVLYIVVTSCGMVTLVRFAYKGLLRLNWHSLEHNAGIITGVTLVATGIFSYFIG